MRCKSFIYICLFFLASCHNRYASDVKEALLFAGSNRSELEYVLEHYAENRADSLKFRAACFLIGNMPHHFNYPEEPYRAYCASLDSLFLIEMSYEDYIKEANIILRHHARKLRPLYDSHTITGDYLIWNIDHAFDQWETLPYLEHLNFDEFCEYVLPYKCLDGQPLNKWKQDWNTQGVDMKNIPQIDEYKYNVRRFVEAANRDFSENCRMTTLGTDDMNILDILDLYTLAHRPYGSCKEMAQLVLLNTRSKALPVSLDFTPAWPDRSASHFWNNLFSAHRTNIDFEGLGYPGERHYQEKFLGKVYRISYSPHPLLLQALEQEGEIPNSLSLFTRDVTDAYGRTTTISIPVQPCMPADFAYLATFDNEQWIPGGIGKIKRGKAVFEKVPLGILYIAGTYKDGAFIPSSDPFIVDTRKRVTPLKTSQTETLSIHLTRKFPAFEHVHWVNEYLRMGRIEASDTPDFIHADSITDFPEWHFLAGEEIIRDTVPHRYWRLISSTPHSSDFAEIYFYERRSGKRIKGELLHPDAPVRNKSHDTPEYICDDDPLTYFATENTDTPRWVGFDFGAPVAMQKVAYIRRGDGNDICPDDTYELYYWKNGQWVLHERQKAENVYIDFEDVPAGGLYFIRDSTRGMQNRTFVYRNGVVRWY